MLEDPRPAWRHELATTGSWVRRTPPVRMLAPGVGCLVFCAVGVAFLLSGETALVVLGVVTLLTFGVAFGSVVVWRAVTGKPVLRLDRGGVVLDRVGVPWSEVAGTGTYAVRGSRTLVLALTPAGRARRDGQGTAAGRALRSANDRLVGGPALHVPAGYGIPVELLAAWVEEVRLSWSAPPSW